MSRLFSASQDDVRDNDSNLESIRGSVTGGMANEGRVLVLYTGGTIGMMRNEQGGNYFVKFKRLFADFQKM